MAVYIIFLLHFRFVVAGEDLQNAVVSSNVFDFEKEYELTKEMVSIDIRT